MSRRLLKRNLEGLSKQEVKRIYDLNAKRYEAFYAHEQRLKHDVALRNADPRSIVLDAGCGTGLLLEKLSDDCLSVGLDVSISMLRIALAKGVSSPLVLGDVEEAPFRSSAFNTCYAITVLQLTEDQHKTLSELKRVLKPGGVLVVTAHRSTRTSRALKRLVNEVGLKVKKVINPDDDCLDLMVVCSRE